MLNKIKDTLTEKDIKRFKKTNYTEICNVTDEQYYKTSNWYIDKFRENYGVNALELQEMSRFWDSLSDMRKRAYRAWRYRRGFQWDDIIDDPNHLGKTIKEEDNILRQGKPAFVQNIISQLMRTIVGQYRANPVRSSVMARASDKQVESEMLTNALQSCLDRNQFREVDVENLQQFLISGISVGKVKWIWWDEEEMYDGKIDNVSPFMIGFNSDINDSRNDDMWLLFELHDMRIEDVKAKFARTKEEAEAIEQLYSNIDRYNRMPNKGLSAELKEFVDFYIPKDPTLCRVIERWEKRDEWRLRVLDKLTGDYYIAKGDIIKNKEEIQRINNKRRSDAVENGIDPSKVVLIYKEELSKYWYVKFLTPYGECLRELESPYKHKSHPYAIKMNMLNGDTWGLVEELIDQQRMINRSMILMDFIISASAKGILLVPEDVIPADMNINDFADEWTKFNGVIKYKPNKSQQVPQQVSANSVNIGVGEMLNMQMQLISQIAGVNPALQGQEAKSGTPAALYAESAQNSALNIKNTLEQFNSYVLQRDKKLLKVLIQNYETGRYVAVSGKGYYDEAKKYDASKVKNLDFDMVIANQMDTPFYRMMIEERLSQLLINQIIDPIMYFENSTLPFSDSLLNQLKAKQKEMQQSPESAQYPPELLQQMQAQAGANPSTPETQNVMNKIMGG